MAYRSSGRGRSARGGTRSNGGGSYRPTRRSTYSRGRSASGGGRAVTINLVTSPGAGVAQAAVANPQVPGPLRRGPRF